MNWLKAVTEVTTLEALLALVNEYLLERPEEYWSWIPRDARPRLVANLDELHRWHHKLAAEVGVDPLEIRERNWIKHEEFPFTTVAGLEYDSGNYEAATAKAKEHFGYDELRAEQKRRRESGDPVQLGIGVSTFTEMCGLAPSRVLGQLDYGAGGWESAQVRMLATGKVEVVTGASALSPHLGQRMMAARLLDTAVVLRELTPQDLKIELDALTHDEAVAIAQYLGAVIGRAHGRQMDRSIRAGWLAELGRRRPQTLDAPSWLWTAVVDLIAIHEAEYLDHCRRYAAAHI